MADQKISELNTITGANVDDASDKFAIVDASGNETKAITREELFKSVDGTTFHVDSTNNRVGVGTITPSVDFEVDGDVAVSNAFPTVQLRDKNSTGTSIGGLFALTNADATDPIAWFGVPDEDGVVHVRAFYGDIVLRPGSSASTTEVMRVQDNGRVGIGTSSPSVELDVVGEAKVSGDFTVDTSTLHVDSANNRVGIGTTSPSALLDVEGGDTEAVSIVTDGHIQLYDPTGTTRAYTFLSRNSINSMVGGNFRIDDSVTTGSHVGYSKGTDARGGSGILFDNTSGGNYGSIVFLQNNDTNDDTWSVQEAMRIVSSGNVGIGTTSPSEKLDVSGNVTISGSLSKGSGSFKIDHPLKPETHHLVHSFVEAPQADNIYRGRVDLVDGVATVNLDESGRMTEGTFVLLNGNVQCFTSNETDWCPVRGSVNGNILTIEAQDNTCTDTISWLVIGERIDQHMIDTNWTDENGRIIVEPEKVIMEPEEEAII